MFVLPGKQIRSFVVGSRCVGFFIAYWLYLPVGNPKDKCLTLVLTRQDLCSSVSGGASVRVSTHQCGCGSEIERLWLILNLWLSYQPRVFHGTGWWQTWLCSRFIRGQWSVCEGIVSAVAQSQDVTLIWLFTLDQFNVIIFEHFVWSFKQVV